MPFRKPLIVMTPKSLLRHPDAKSPLTDMVEGTRFKRLIPDNSCENGGEVVRVIFCSGKVYYELAKEREKLGLLHKVAIARMEQISPFPYDLVYSELERFPNAKVIWAQEEPKNMGAWSYVQPRLYKTADYKRGIEYRGRAPNASVATGNKHHHMLEQAAVLSSALTGL